MVQLTGIGPLKIILDDGRESQNYCAQNTYYRTRKWQEWLFLQVDIKIKIYYIISVCTKIGVYDKIQIIYIMLQQYCR